MRIGRVTVIVITVLCACAGATHAQEPPSSPQAQQTDILPDSQPQPLSPTPTVPNLPNTCRGAANVNAFLYEVATCLSDSEHVRVKVGEIGHSQRGIPILMVTVVSVNQAVPCRGGLMIVARQHGNEPAGTRAALEFIRRLALDQENMSAMLGSMTVRVIPVANPDGMDLFQRRTANGKDMNRDWNTKHLPETRAVAETIRASQPNVLMDLHELTPGDGNRAYVLGIPGARAAGMLRSVKESFINHGISTSTRTTERYSTTGLLHRHFANISKGAAFLVESKYTGDPTTNLKERSEYHLRAVMGVIEGMDRK